VNVPFGTRESAVTLYDCPTAERLVKFQAFIYTTNLSTNLDSSKDVGTVIQGNESLMSTRL